MIEKEVNKMEETRKHIEELVEKLNYYSFEYYNNDNSVVSDYEFDMLMQELKNLERKYPQYFLSLCIACL